MSADALPATVADENVIPLWTINWRIYSPMGQIDGIQCVQDDDAAIAACKAHRVSIIMLPQFRIQRAPALILVSRKPPFHDRSAQFCSESDHPGMFTEFYQNPRGRFMRINDAYQHAVYQLQRAAFSQVPPDFPDPDPDFDIAWFPV